MKSNPSTGSAAELADESADDKGREIVLKNHKLLRRLYLQERLEVNEDVCAICDFNREILYYGNYDRNRNVECFNVCELCGKDLITNSAALEAHSDESALAALKEKETLQRQYWAVRLLNVQETFGDAFTGVGLRRIALEICPELDAPTMMEVEEKRQALVQKLRAIGTDEVIRAKLDAGTQKQEGP